MHAVRSVILCALLLTVSSAPALAQRLPFAPDVPLDGVTGYSPEIPTHEAIIGHEIGTRHTDPAQVVEYFRAVDERTERVVLRQHGRTYEGRPLIHAIVTSPANHARLEEIRRANLHLSDAPGEVGEAELRGMPAIVYMGYSIHGNEASGTEAALLLLYHLAAGEGPGVTEILDRTVIILDPLFNPDGRDRFVDWVNRNRGAVATTDGQDREHNEPWPFGRTNHYWFDLNRDWLPAAHPESQARLALFHSWRPQVLTDHHEMSGNATFFFQPGIPSRVHPVTPASNQELTRRIGTYHALALDRIGSLYYTEEDFDDFYYGKGSTYPDVNGAVGILFEQASSRALMSETRSGTLRYDFTIRNQLVTSLSTLRAVADLREELLRHQRDFYAEAPAVARENPVKAYVIGLEPDPTRARALAGLLRRHRVRVHELTREVEAGGQRYRPGEAYMVPMDQPQTRLLRGVMERMTEFQDSLFYDISTWTLPLAYGLDYAEMRRDAGAFTGDVLPDSLPGTGRAIGGEASFAYAIPWGRYLAPRVLFRIQEAGMRVRLATRPFEADVAGERRRFERGTLIVAVPQAPAEAARLHGLIRTATREDDVEAYALGSGSTPGGPELGGPTVPVLEQPRVALLTGAGVDASGAGEVWHLLSERMRMPVSLLDVTAVASADLSRYNTLVLADGGYGDLPADKLKAWVQQGGRLVALEGGAGWAVRSGLASLKASNLNVDSLVADVSYEQVEIARDAHDIAGAILETRLDPTHPVAYGYGASIPVFRTTSAFYQPFVEPGTNVAVYTPEPLLSGYLSDERRRQAGGALSVYATRYGAGRVALFFDNPNFRAFWYGTNGLFLNAVFFGGAF